MCSTMLAIATAEAQPCICVPVWKIRGNCASLCLLHYSPLPLPCSSPGRSPYLCEVSNSFSNSMIAMPSVICGTVSNATKSTPVSSNTASFRLWQKFCFFASLGSSIVCVCACGHSYNMRQLPMKVLQLLNWQMIVTTKLTAVVQRSTWSTNSWKGVTEQNQRDKEEGRKRGRGVEEGAHGKVCCETTKYHNSRCLQQPVASVFCMEGECCCHCCCSSANELLRASFKQQQQQS